MVIFGKKAPKMPISEQKPPADTRQGIENHRKLLLDPKLTPQTIVPSAAGFCAKSIFRHLDPLLVPRGRVISKSAKNRQTPPLPPLLVST